MGIPLEEPAAAGREPFVLLLALPPALHDRLLERAHRDGTNMAGVARKALEAYLRRGGS